MGRTPKPVLLEVEDFEGYTWDVYEILDTEHDFPIYKGMPTGHRLRGKPWIILTREIADHLEVHRRARPEDRGMPLPERLRLPISQTACKRLRRELGHNGKLDAAAWWLDRLDDLGALTSSEFVAKHPGKSVDAVDLARMTLLGPRRRARGWYRSPEVAAILGSGRPDRINAEELGIATSTAATFRAALDLPGIPRGRPRIETEEQ